MPWLRSGECNRCGDCCRSGDPFTGQPGLCSLGREEPDGKVTCTGQLGETPHPYYLNGCNVWPSVPEHIAAYPNCSYRFTWVD